MKKLMPFFIAMLIAAPALAANEDDAARQAQCQAQATQQGLKGEEASDFVADCMEEGQDSAAPQQESSKADN